MTSGVSLGCGSRAVGLLAHISEDQKAERDGCYAPFPLPLSPFYLILRIPFLQFGKGTGKKKGHLRKYCRVQGQPLLGSSLLKADSRSICTFQI